MKLKAAVIGSTGMVGSALLDQLSKDSDYAKITSFARSPLQSPTTKISEKTLPIDWKAEAGVDATVAFCCIGSSRASEKNPAKRRAVDYEMVIDFAQWCGQSGIGKFIVISSTGAKINSPFEYYRCKAEMELELAKIKIPSITILRPGLLIGNRKERRLFEDIFKFVYKTLNPNERNNKWATDADDLSQLMLNLGKQSNTGVQILSATEIAMQIKQYEE